MTSWAVNGDARVLVIGGGYSGRRFAAAARRLGARLWLTHRSAEAPDGEPGWLRFDAQAGQVPSLPDGLSHVLVTLPPDGTGSDSALQHLLPQLRQQPLQALAYLSTTGVYGNAKGGWVNETSPTDPSLPRSRARLDCERRWLSSGLPATSFRLPAIYGPGRCPFQQLRQGTARLVHKPGQVFCRIHVDDIVGAVLHCLALDPQQRQALVNVSDACPCPSSETLGYAAHLLGCKLPPLQRYDTIAATMSPMALSFWADNRRVSNRRLCRELGYRLLHPTYREGLRASLAEEQAAGEPLPA